MQPDEGLFTRQVPGDRYRQQTDPVLQLENINVSFDGFKALTDLTLNIGVGELRCVIGPNGAGKTTLMDVITGKTRPQSGKALYDQSTDLTTLIRSPLPARNWPQVSKPTVFEALTVEENLELAMKNNKSVWASLRARLNSEQRDRIDEMLGLLRLANRKRAQRRDVVARSEAVSRDRHAAGAGTASAAAGRTCRRDDGCGNGIYRRVVPHVGG